mgnify:CR=1 FL=1
MTRIAVGAFLHETNTFAPTKATYDDFVHGGGWRIDELLATMGIPTRRHRGLRVTDEKTLTVVEMALDEPSSRAATACSVEPSKNVRTRWRRAERLARSRVTTGT